MFSVVNNSKNAINGKTSMYPAAGIYGISCCVAHLYFLFIWRRFKHLSISFHFSFEDKNQYSY
ncbi:hypothetical protein BH10BAC2_BH10BAC2_30560 [soil metagenome]